MENRKIASLPQLIDIHVWIFIQRLSLQDFAGEIDFDNAHLDLDSVARYSTLFMFILIEWRRTAQNITLIH